MAGRAGVDLVAYGSREEEAWVSLGIHDPRVFEQFPGHFRDVPKVEGLLYGPTSAHWSLRLSRGTRHRVFKLQSTPGSFSKESDMPTVISWRPSEEDREEGYWQALNTWCSFTGHFDLRDSSEAFEPYTELIDGVQDDTGAIMLMQQRFSPNPKTLRRRCGQPPELQRQDTAYLARRTSEHHRWLPPYHFCQFDARWRCDCLECHGAALPWAYLSDHARQVVFNGRTCIYRPPFEHFTVQESWRWLEHSFLRDIALCQDRWAPDDSYSSSTSRQMMHTGTRDCPQRCYKIQVGRMKVPEAHWPYHPEPRFGHFSGIDAEAEAEDF
jgi:hypothetical protein